LDRKERKLLGLIENMTRKDLTTIEIAFAYHDLIENLGVSQEELAQVLTCSKKTIQRYLSLTAWPEAAIEILRQYPSLFSTDFLFNGISSDIRSDPDLLLMRLRKKVDQVIEPAADQPKPQNTKSQQTPDTDDVMRWNEAVRKNLGVPVTMSGSKDNLRITIRCTGDENVRKILERLGIGAD
jgi:hypothetical protein